ncbi:hypothetical protein K0504_10160 [Neiella marina]|uniref:Uncharacterized protein n=1 Tax=Neiella holothuriorum TaxID=2870530 RepID=A0ABS7EGD6_9GAMM|nr:hypothetical protein [Neiella holothuriorum]MBW8191402.1 hypothetical protein [Neiella holothuriorum]
MTILEEHMPTPEDQGIAIVEALDVANLILRTLNPLSNETAQVEQGDACQFITIPIVEGVKWRVIDHENAWKHQGKAGKAMMEVRMSRGFEDVPYSTMLATCNQANSVGFGDTFYMDGADLVLRSMLQFRIPAYLQALSTPESSLCQLYKSLIDSFQQAEGWQERFDFARSCQVFMRQAHLDANKVHGGALLL